MKRIMSIALALVMALALAACQGAASSSAPASSSAQPESAAAPSESVSAPEEEPAEESAVESMEEEPAEEAAPVTMTSGENSVSILAGDETVAEFTLPTETPIYDELKYMDDGQTAMMTHDIMNGVSGRTIVEAFKGTAEEYIDFYKSITFGSENADATVETRDLNGTQVLVSRRESIDSSISRDYVIAVPVAENAVLGFRINSVSNQKYEVQFEDGVIDILLSHCVF
ncbi:MAG TPA: hypothetical protein H9883_04060 [Candidatus Ruthenibacterium merdigallinarum]|nr:hypothetical protein [Candidatus Ruthenibacterium merdigallinarum]